MTKKNEFSDGFSDLLRAHYSSKKESLRLYEVRLDDKTVREFSEDADGARAFANELAQKEQQRVELVETICNPHYSGDEELENLELIHSNKTKFRLTRPARHIPRMPHQTRPSHF